MRKSSCGDCEVGERGTGVSVNLTALTLQACAGPPAYVAIDVRPDIAGGNQALSCFNTGVGEVMNTIKKGSTKRVWNKRPRFTSGNIGGYGGIGGGDGMILELKR